MKNTFVLVHEKDGAPFLRCDSCATAAAFKEHTETLYGFKLKIVPDVVFTMSDYKKVYKEYPHDEQKSK